MKYFIGVDVGTGSVRSALVKSDGTIVCSASQEIKIWNPRPNFYQQSSKDIWSAVVKTVQTVCKEGGIVNAEEVGGLGFDATCSLVVQGADHEPISICPTGEPDCDIIMWMDHRAAEEADFINSTKHTVLKYTGGVISLEMEPPKLLWLKKNLKEACWDKAAHFLDLCDFLTWKATRSLTRSLCSVVSKWTYCKDGGFSKEFYELIGLGELCADDWQKIGCVIKAQGEPCGNGLTAEVAAELGLKPGTPVGVGMIDAHAGSIGCLGCIPKDSRVIAPSITGKMALISGTSTCHMALSQEPIFVPGVWGPFWSSILPGMWSAEGGQSAAGKLIDHVIETHPAYDEAMGAKGSTQHVSDFLYDILVQEAKSQGLATVAHLTQNFHMWPDYHGNRSPLADHTLRGMISGLTLQSDVVGMATLYLATVQALAYGTRHILSELLKCGHQTSMLNICGGLRKNQLYISTHADVTGLAVVVPNEEESVLLGSAILGATAAGLYPSIQKCMENMCGQGEVTLPDTGTASYHEKKYNVFLKMYEHQRQYQTIMANV